MLTRDSRRAARTGEEGQVLILALAFIAFVGVVSVALFRYADATQLQHKQTSATAAAHAPSEGAALYALIDSSRPDAPVCAAGNSGSVVFAGTGALSYTVAASGCTVSGHSGTGAAGENCVLCILNPTNGTPFFADRAITVAGEVDMNGVADFQNHNGSLCVKAAATDTGCTGTIGDHGGNLADSGFMAATKVDPGQVRDPLSGIYPMPPTTTPAGLPPLNGFARPGVYGSISNVKLCPGTYIITGSTGFGPGLTMAPAGAAACSANPGDGVTIVLACGTATTWTPCTSGQVGGGLSYTGVNDVSTLVAPTKGIYANLVIFVDPLNAGTLNFGGNGHLDITGTTYAPSMNYTSNGGGATVAGGRVVIGLMSLQHNSNGSGFTVSGTIPVSTSCGVASDTLSAAGGSSQGRVVVQTACNGGNQIVSFDYQP
jgi:hypothetical protein